MIITVDDFGFHHRANQLIERGIQEKFITHVSTMVNMVGSEEALRYLKREYVHVAPIVFGLHMNITDPSAVFLNSHHHINSWPTILRAVTPVAKRHKIELIRQPSKLWWPTFWQRYGMKGVTIELLSMTQRCGAKRFTHEFVDFDWVDLSDEARFAALSKVPKDAELSCHPHIFTTAADPKATPNPTCTLEWLLDHKDLVRKHFMQS